MTDNPENHSSKYLDRLETAMAVSGKTQTAFGYEHFGDPGFLTRMRKGTALRRKTVEKLERVLDSFEKGI